MPPAQPGRVAVAMRSPPDGAALRRTPLAGNGTSSGSGRHKDRDAKCPSLRVSLDSAHPANGWSCSSATAARRVDGPPAKGGIAHHHSGRWI